MQSRCPSQPNPLHPLHLRPLQCRCSFHACDIALAFTFAVFHQDRALGPDASWNAMISACPLLSCNSNAISYYALMISDGVMPKEHTYPLLLKSNSRAENKNVNLIHAHIMKFRFGSGSFVSNSLVSCYVDGDELESVCEVFDEMPQRDRISLIALVNGHVKCGLPGKSLSLFVKMKNEGAVEIDKVTIATILKAAGMVGNVLFGRWIHGFYLESGRVEWDVYLGSVLVDMYATCHSCDDAKKMFEQLPFRNVVTWSALIAGYVHCDRFSDAQLVFQDMLVEKFILNQVTGCSWLEVNDRFHEFIALDHSHSQSKKIYETFDAMKLMMKKLDV